MASTISGGVGSCTSKKCFTLNQTGLTLNHYDFCNEQRQEHNLCLCAFFCITTYVLKLALLLPPPCPGMTLAHFIPPHHFP